MAFVDRSHEVRWAVAPEACERVRAAGFQAHPAGIDQGTRMAEFRRRYPDALSLPPLELPRVMVPAFFGEICPPPVPQTALLPQCAAVVSHGGSGTVLAGLGLGLPQVCVPQGTDQFINAVQAAAVVGAAVSLMPDQASPASIAAAVDRVLRDPAIAAGAARVSRELAAMPGPDEVAAKLEALL